MKPPLHKKLKPPLHYKERRFRGLWVLEFFIFTLFAACGPVTKKEVRHTQEMPAVAEAPTAAPTSETSASEATPPAQTESPAKPAQAPALSRTHKLGAWGKTRDCLWNISKRIYGTPHRWGEIWEANRARIRDPRRIPDGAELILP